MMKIVVAGTLSLIALAMGAPAYATDHHGVRCKNCPASRPHYDSQEVVRTTRDVDHSRVINTQSMVPVSKRYRTTNHLVIRKNTIRNYVGVIRHNHTIIEKEIPPGRGQLRHAKISHRAPAGAGLRHDGLSAPQGAARSRIGSRPSSPARGTTAAS